MRKLDSESSTDRSIISEKPSKNLEHCSKKNMLISSLKDDNSSSTSEIYSDSLENLHQATDPIEEEEEAAVVVVAASAVTASLVLNECCPNTEDNNINNNSNNTSSSRNRNSSEISSTSTSSSSGMQLYDVENAMLTNNIDNSKVESRNYNSEEYADLTEKSKSNEEEEEEAEDYFDEASAPVPQLGSSSVMKRTHLKNLIHELYELSEISSLSNEESASPNILIQGFMEKLPPGKNLKNSILLAWRKRYFQLSSIGVLSVFDNVVNESVQEEPIEVYNLMGGRVEYEPNRVISLDDSRGNFLVCRCCPMSNEQLDDEEFAKWKNAIDSQIVDRSDSLWVKPNQPLVLLNTGSRLPADNKKVLIIDIGTCSIRAGLFNNVPQLPQMFVPTVCSRNQASKLNVGFEAFEALLSSAAASTIDLHKSLSTWSLASGSVNSSSHLIFPLRAKNNIDKLNMDMESIEAILGYVVEQLNVTCADHQVVVITTHKLSDKVNIQLLNMLLDNEKFQFESATIINQTLLTLYAYNSNVGIVANLGEHIDIVPICNG